MRSKVLIIIAVSVFLFSGAKSAIAATAPISLKESQLLIVSHLLSADKCNTWSQDSIKDPTGASLGIQNFYNWHTHFNDIVFKAGCTALALGQVLRFWEHPKTPPMSNNRSLVGEEFDVYWATFDGNSKSKILTAWDIT